MKNRNCILCLALALLLVGLTACSAKMEPASADPEPESVDTTPEPAAEPAEPEPEPAEPVPEIESDEVLDDDMLEPLLDGGSEYVSGGLKLTVPEEYAPLVQIGMGTSLFGSKELFSAREIASVEAGQKLHPGEDWGDGFLFSIARVSEEELHRMLCGYLNNERPFARDADGNYYICYYPSDVRLVREDMENLANSPDLEQWSALNEWAAKVPEQFVKDNPGLERWDYDYSDVAMYLNRIAYFGDETEYSLFCDFVEYKPKGDEGAKYALQLLENVEFEYCSADETPDGEYQVVSFPQENARIFFYKGGEYAAVDYGGDYGSLYRISAPSAGYCLDVLAEWAKALGG